MIHTHTETEDNRDNRFWRRWYLMVLLWHVLVTAICYLITSLYHPAG